MKMNLLNMKSVCAVLLISAVCVQAADKAKASGILSGIAATSVQAKSNLSEAAVSGDVDRIGEASKRSDAVDVAYSEGQQAYSDMERADESGDSDSANSAFDNLVKAKQKAVNALAGNVSEKTVVKKTQKKKAIGGPGYPYDPPNIYANLANTSLKSGVLQSLFGNFWATSAFGTRVGFGDREATPE